MRRLSALLVVFGLVAAACSAGGEQPIVAAPSPGAAMAPDFTVETIDGVTFTLSETLRQRPVVINFWASWCPPCRLEMPDFDEISRATPGVQFIGVAIGDTEDAATAYAREIGISYPIAVDLTGSVAAAYGVNALPQTWLVAQNGQVVRTVRGAITKEVLSDLIRQDLGVTPGD
jgi:thiol-disulfide isomerase/thioredoxin